MIDNQVYRDLILGNAESNEPRDQDNVSVNDVYLSQWDQRILWRKSSGD